MTPTTALPTFLLIGAARAGTTAVHAWLAGHPDVCMSRPKETQFFTLGHEQGMTRYAQHFGHHAGEAAIGESTPVYLSLPSVPARIAATLPDVQLIAILRDPAEQAFSAWWKMRALGAERRSFTDAIEDELRRGSPTLTASERSWARLHAHAERGRPDATASYLLIGRYEDAIRRYHEHFELDQLHVLLYEDLVSEPEVFAGRVCEIIGVDHAAAPEPSPATRNQSTGPTEAWVRRRTASESVPSIARRLAGRAGREVDRRRPRPRLDPHVRSRLDAYFAAANGGLGDLIDRDVSHWFQR